MKESVARRPSDEQVDSLYTEHRERLTAFAAGLLRDWDLAHEAVQIAFTKVLESGGAVQPDAMKSWLYRVTKNEAIQIRRRQGRETRAVNRLATSLTTTSTQPDKVFEQSETILRVQGAIEKLPVEQREVIDRRIHQDQKFTEIADELDVPLGTVLTRMRLALKRLKQCLNDLTES